MQSWVYRAAGVTMMSGLGVRMTEAACFSYGILAQVDIVAGLDPGHDILRLDPKMSFFTPEQLDESVITLKRLLAQRRARGRAVKLIVDNRGLVAQSSETAARMRASANAVHHASDRIAILVDSSLARMQLRRILNPVTHRIFAFEAEALAWLRSES